MQIRDKFGREYQMGDYFIYSATCGTRPETQIHVVVGYGSSGKLKTHEIARVLDHKTKEPITEFYRVSERAACIHDPLRGVILPDGMIPGYKDETHPKMAYYNRG